MINLIQQIRSEARPRPLNIKMKSLIFLSVLITLINVALVLGGYTGHSCKGCLFTNDNVWARVEGNIATVGISDVAQEMVGPVVFLDFPYIDTRVESGESFAFLTSIFRGGTDLYSPFTGTIIEVNSELDDYPEYVNDDETPYDDGWMIKIKLEDPDEIEGLMSEQEYLHKKQETDTQQWTFDKEAYTISPFENKVYGHG